MRYPGPAGVSGTLLAACVSPALLCQTQILESEGQRQSKINVAEGRKVEVVLASEGAREDAINRATGAPCRLHCRVCSHGRIRPTSGPSDHGGTFTCVVANVLAKGLYMTKRAAPWSVSPQVGIESHLSGRQP